MKLYSTPIFLFFYFMTLANATSQAGPANLQLMDQWRFHQGEVQGAEKPGFADSDWTPVRLPHDWSIGLLPRESEPGAGGGGYFPAGIGWYRRVIEAPASWEGEQVFIHFEGVYQNAEVFINGYKVGERANGYVPFRAELTDHLKLGKDNLLAVRVDNSNQPNSRWYTGSGIYRPVWIEVRHPVHITPGGLFVHTTDLYPDAASLEAQTRITNKTGSPVTARLEFSVISPDGLPVNEAAMDIEVGPGESGELRPKLVVANPRLWSPESPSLYRLVARLSVDELLTDRSELSFGIRTIEVDSQDGLLLNSEPVLLLGGNVHHDNGPLGAMAYRDADFRKVRLLKEAGFNAVRTAHNPPSTAFLDACDQLGLLVIAEAFDAWKAAKVEHDYNRYFDDNWEQDLTDFILRDRNHPSVIMWSIGNEMYERGNEDGIRIAAEMARTIKDLDATRPVTAGVNGMGEKGDWSDLDPLFSHLDVVGYNYELASQHAMDHVRVPDRIIYESESFHTDLFGNWKILTLHPHVLGDFVWSAMDYLGEAGIGRVFSPNEESFSHWEGEHFPWHGAACGDIDLTGFRKPVSHYRNIVWDRGETLYMAVRPPSTAEGQWNPTPWSPPYLRESWTWPGFENTPVEVQVFSRHETVRLFLDRTLIGEQAVSKQTEFKAAFTVPYAPGTLTAQGLKGETVVEEYTIQTAGEPRRILLRGDRGEVLPNGEDLVFVEVIIADAGGRRCPQASEPVLYTIEGPAEIVTTGSADLAATQAYGANPRDTFQGRALVVIRAFKEPGDILLRASSEGLIEGAVSIRSAWPR